MKNVLISASIISMAAGSVLAQSFPSPIPINSTQVGIRDIARLPNPDAVNVPRMSVATYDTSGRLFVNDQRGPLYTVDKTSGSVVEYFDIRDYLGTDLRNSNGEQGFQSFAFHPDFTTPNAPGFGRFYTMHSTSNVLVTPDFELGDATTATSHHEVLIEWRTNNPAAASFTPVDSGAPYRELMRWDKPFGNHNGGLITFNPNGGADRNNLYVMMGDGGAANDVFNAGQNTDKAFGKLMRINPLGNDSANGKYGIVPDNVFAMDANPATLGEIYAYGLRNPQRYGWDSSDGKLYIADIGQDAKEEINIAVNGGNFGWDLREGSVFPADGFINPVAEWLHTVEIAPHPSALPAGFVLNADATTMGEIVRGSDIDFLNGILMAGDNPKGVMYMLDVDSDPLDGGGEGWTELIPYEESTGVQKRLITMINEERAMLGLAEANRADLRFGVNTPGEVFILNKQDGVLRMLVNIPEPTTLAALVMPMFLLARRVR